MIQTAFSPENMLLRCTIPLTQGQITIVDAADYEWLMQWKWCALWAKSTQSFYAVRSGPRDENYKQERFIMARVIKGAPKGVVVDHEDHDTLNNRRSNLRLASYGQNGFNRRKHTQKSSEFKGVSWHNGDRKWRVSIKADGKRISLGQYYNEEEAGAAYAKAALELHGEFVHLARYSEAPG